MNKTVLLTATAVLALTAGGAMAAAPMVATHAKPAVQHVRPAGTLYSQNSNFKTVSLVSDNFTSGSFSTYDDTGADDFVVPAGKTWKVKGMDVTGVYFNGSGPATSEVVTFYHGGKTPTTVIGTPQTLSCTDTTGTGSFSCALTTPVKLRGGTKGKHYWVGLQANMDFGTHGEWGWTLTTIQNDAAQWENPGGGFGVCPTWGTNQSCLGYSGDYAFDLTGRSS